VTNDASDTLGSSKWATELEFFLAGAEFFLVVSGFGMDLEWSVTSQRLPAEGVAHRTSRKLSVQHRFQHIMDLLCSLASHVLQVLAAGPVPTNTRFARTILGKPTARNLSCKARLYAVELHLRPRFNIGMIITGVWDANATF